MSCSVDLGPYEYQTYSSAGVLGDTSLCFDSNGHVLIGTGDSLLWYTDAGLSNLVNSGDTLVHMENPGLITYFVTDSTINCPREVVDTIGVSVLALPVINLGLDTAYCVGDSILLNAGVGFNYQWSTLETSQTIYVTQGTYHVTITNGNNCMNSDTIVVNENALPIIDLGVDETFCVYNQFDIRCWFRDE